MAASEPVKTKKLSASETADDDDLLTLADLAGITAPGNIMKIILELIKMEVPPEEIHLMIRNVLTNKSRGKRGDRRSSKHSSKRPLPTSTTDAVQENTDPQT